MSYMRKHKPLTRVMAAFLVLIMVVTLLPVSVFAADTAPASPSDLAGKRISILGDSISTFAGVSNDTSVNATLKGSSVYYSNGTLGVSRQDTWWQQTIDLLGLELLVNNSWSGSCIRPTRSGTTGAYLDRCVQLHNDKTGEEPDIIAVFIGTNDVSYYQSTLGTADIFYDEIIFDNGDGTFSYADPDTSCEAYAIMLHKMQQRYPDAEIYCMTMLPRRAEDYSGDSITDVGQPTAFNEALTEIIEDFGCTAVDLENCGIAPDITNFDEHIADKRVHPGPLGMDEITEALVSAMLGEAIKLYNVDAKLTGVTTETLPVCVIGGESLSVMLQPATEGEELAVTVTMGGEDVTDRVYENGSILIPEVTGHVLVQASCKYNKAPAHYVWAFDGDALVSEGADDNPLTMQGGSLSNGIYNGAYWKLAEPVYLAHDRSWSVELKCAGNWSGMLFSSHANSRTDGVQYLFRTTQSTNLVAFGEYREGNYHNYGLPLTGQFADAAYHTYRVENRIFDDGSNMAYLIVDGIELGPMADYYIAGNNSQNRDVDWVSGRDFLFTSLGASAHPMNNFDVHRVEVWEEEPSDLAGKTISILGASISTYNGISNGAAANTTNSTIGSNVKYYPNTTIPEVTAEDTWWMQVADDLGLRLLVNNAWSGSAILLDRAGTVGAYVDRCVQLHDDTGDNAGEEPDIICIQMGFNDFGYGKSTLGTADIDYDTLINGGDYAVPVTTMEATAIMLDKMTKRYPNAEIYMFNHFKRIGQSADDTVRMERLNEDIQTVCSRYGVTVVDLYNILTEAEYIGDGNLHPNNLGMDVITEAVKDAILGQTRYQAEPHTVTLQLTDVTADCLSSTLVNHGSPYHVKLTAPMNLGVTVTMGGTDITDTAYKGDGAVAIDEVLGDVQITAQSYFMPREFVWRFDGSELVSEGRDDNPLTRTAGTTADGIFSKTQYALTESVVLKHDQPWQLEWKSEGEMQNGSGGNGCRLFNHAELNNTENAPYLFKSSKNYIIALGERVGGVGQNYGIALADHGIDGSESHIYGLVNRVNGDGTNMVYLWVDGVEIGPMNHHYKALVDTGNTSDWISGKDFVFNFMGTQSHALNDCSIEYIKVWEAGDKTLLTPVIELLYDDRYDVSGMDVEILSTGDPTSYRVGYGIEENTVPDTAVVTLDGDKLIATGIGTAKVILDNVTHEVVVRPAPLSLLFLAGQSNMQGIDGDAGQSIACPDGQVYATYADRWYRTVKDYRYCAPSALTGEYRTVNAAGTTEELSDYPVYMLTEEGGGREGMDSGIAYEWNRQTGDKVWVVNMGYGGSSINAWQAGGTHYNASMTVLVSVADTLRREIAAGHYTLSHMGYFWCQGCADETQTAQWYVDKYLSMHKTFLTDIAFDHDSDPATPDAAFEFGGIIPIRAGHEGAGSYRAGTYTQTTSASYYQSFKDLRMNGPRVAQYYMGNDPALTDIWNVCTIQERWATMPDGSDGVAAYFDSAYPNGIVDYTPQVAQSDAWYKPTTPAAVHDNIHYNQIGYNEIGREAARNALINLGETEAPNTPVTVEFVTWDGFTPAEGVTASTTPNSGTLVVPMVSPVYRSKDVTYSVSDGLAYDYYDLTAEGGGLSGTLRASVGDRIVSVTPKTPAVFRWRFNGTDLAPVSGDGLTENKLTRAGGSVSGGLFNNLQYRAAESMLLSHDRPWRVEWTVDSWDTDLGSMLLSGGGSSTSGLPYLYQRSADYFVGFGYYDGSKYHNYGLALKPLGFNGEDGAAHTIRLENRVADDGSNEIWLLADGKEYGVLDQHFLNSDVQNDGADWLSGRDFSFTALGCSDFPLRGWVMEELTVNEIGSVSLSLQYDDRYDIGGKTVEIIDAGTPTSYRVGYGIEENTVPDTAVVTLSGDKLIATGIGTAMVSIDGELHEIEVTAAPISLLLLAGQSNMRGSEGNADQSIVCPEGMVYSTYGDDRGEHNTAMTVNNARQFAPSALTGEYSDTNVEGTTACLSGYPVNSLTEAGAGKAGPDSGFAYEWVQSTGEKVWVVNAAHGGTSINVWQPGTTEYEECQALFTACAETLRKEIAAGHFTLSHMAYFWCQGCTDRGQSAKWYVDKYLAMHNSFKSELAFDHDSDPATADKTFEFGGIIPVRVGSTAKVYRDGVNADQNPYAYHESFVDLRMSGPRVAQYLMGNDPNLTDIWNVCTIGEDWVWMPDGTNGVSDYFNQHYPNGTVNYTTQVQQSAAWYKPTTPKAVHDSIHYNQIGYNEIGRESVRNALIMLGEKADYTAETTVKFVDWTGYKEVTEIGASATPNSATLVVPMVSPVTRCKTVTYTLSDGLTYDYYDLTAANGAVEGTLTAVGAKGSVTVTKQTPGLLYADHLSTLPETFCAGTNLWNVLEHDPEYYASGTNWAKYSGGNVCSVTIPVTEGDRIYATSFGKRGENGHASSNGIRVTFFGDYGVVKTMAPADTYAEFSKNGYLTAPAGATAINVPMWTPDDTNELYVLNKEHTYKSGICTVCGAEQYELSDHLQQLPDAVCAGTNLWTELTPENDYFSGEEWVGKYWSVTFPVEAGERLVADSFGAAGTNGHSTTNGIQVNFFTADGVKVLLPAETYGEYTKNGYLTVPEGATAVNVGRWSETGNGELYLLDREHSYADGKCTVCGAADPDYAAPTPTATPTPTPVVTATPTPTPVVTAEPTATPTPTPVVTVKPTATPTPTPVVTAKPTATPTPTPVVTAKPTATPTPTPVVTAKPTATPTPTPVVTAKPTATPTPTPVVTAKPTATPTPTPVVTAKPTATPTPTPVVTAKPTATPTPTPVVTAKPTATPTPTPVVTAKPTATPTPTPVVTAKPTATPTPTPVVTAKPTATPTPTPVVTAKPTATPTPTPVVTAKPTATPTPTPVVTAKPTATPTPTPVVTAKPTATPTPTPVVTAKPTATPTPTPVVTAKPTATPTPTPVVTVKPTATPTTTPVVTAKPTATPTPTPVVTVKPTATPTPTPVVTAKPTATPTPTPVVTAKPTATPTPTPVVTVKPTATPTPTPVVTVKPTATPTPTPVVTPTVTPTPTPTPTPELDLKNPFVDVREDAYYYAPVLWAKERGITGGISATEFGPDATCTRGQVVMFLWRAAGSPAPESAENPFRDVNRSDYFYTAVLWAVENEITAGIGEGLFGPHETCTRAQVVTFLWASQDRPVPKDQANNIFVDVRHSDYFFEPVLWAVENNVTGGVAADRFGSDMSCARSHVVTFLFKTSMIPDDNGIFDELAYLIYEKYAK